MQKVYFLDSVHPILEERLTNAGYLCVDCTNSPLNDLSKMIVDASGIVLRSKITLNEKVLRNARTSVYCTSGSGLENIDLDYCKKKNVKVYSSPEGNRNAVAEHCLGFLLSLLNNFKQAQCDIHNGEWLREKNRGIEITNLCVGIIGYGNNGRAFAEKLASIGGKVLVYDKYVNGFSKEGIYEINME